MPGAASLPNVESRRHEPRTSRTNDYTAARMRSVFWGFYQLATGVALLAAGPFLLARRGSHYLPTLAGRLGRAAGSGAPAPARSGCTPSRWGRSASPPPWRAALPPELPLLVTTVTPTGQERARAAFAGRSGRVDVAYLPFDLGFAVGAFFRRHRPRALVLVEGDYWPLVLREARRRGLPIAVVNGRVGDRSFGRMRRLRRFLGPLFAGVGRFGVQSGQDRDRLLALGIDARPRRRHRQSQVRDPRARAQAGAGGGPARSGRRPADPPRRLDHGGGGGGGARRLPWAGRRRAGAARPRAPPPGALERGGRPAALARRADRRPAHGAALPDSRPDSRP